MDFCSLVSAPKWCYVLCAYNLSRYLLFGRTCRKHTHLVTAFMLFRNLKFVFLDAHLSKTAFLAHCSKNADQRKKECSSESKICSLQYKNISIEWWQYFYSLNFSQKKKVFKHFWFCTFSTAGVPKSFESTLLSIPSIFMAWRDRPLTEPGTRFTVSQVRRPPIYDHICRHTHTHLCARPPGPTFSDKRMTFKGRFEYVILQDDTILY